jgi:hypothetical protein
MWKLGAPTLKWNMQVCNCWNRIPNNSFYLYKHVHTLKIPSMPSLSTICLVNEDFHTPLSNFLPQWSLDGLGVCSCYNFNMFINWFYNSIISSPVVTIITL